MIQKRGISLSTLLILLLPIEVAAYYVSGIFVFDDLVFSNVSEKLETVFYDFYEPLRWYNDRTLPCLGIGLIVWVFVVSYLQYHYRNFQHGVEHGSEDWGDASEITKRRMAKGVDYRILTKNLRVPLSGEGAPSNNNMLIIGSSGTYKTTSVLTPNLLLAENNLILLDVKGELMYKYGFFLQSRGYTIRCLNLKDQAKSDRYNPFAYIENETDLIKLVANIYDAVTPEGPTANDPFWTDGPMLYLQAIFFYEWTMARIEGRTGTFNNILKIINEEMLPDTTVKVKKGEKPPSILQRKMDELAKLEGELTPAVRDYRKFKAGAAETVRSIIIIVNAKLKLCETKGLTRIFEDDDMNLREFATGVGGTVEKPSGRKMALFLCVNDNDDSFNYVCSMLYTQAVEILCRMADNDFKDRGGALPIPLEFWMDEFYAGARPHETEKLMGTIRSRNIAMIPILQSVAQIKVVFSAEKWEVLMDNCPTMIFLGSGAGANDTHKYISELLGKMTIDTIGDGRHGNQFNSNYSRMGRELMTPSEVKRMNRKHAIVFLEEERPVYDRKALPWETSRRKGAYYEAMRMNKKSAAGGYVHPVEVVIDPKTGDYLTVDHSTDTHPIRPVRPEEVPEDAKVVSYTEDEFLHANFKGQDQKQKSTNINRFYMMYMGMRAG